MGILTDIVIADRSDARAIAGSYGPLETWPGIDAKGVDVVKLAMLTPVLEETEYDPACIADFDFLAARDDDDGPWVHGVPARLLDALAALQSAESVALRAEEWFELAREEFRSSGYRLPDVRALLHELRELAASAKQTGKELLVWTSL